MHVDTNMAFTVIVSIERAGKTMDNITSPIDHLNNLV